MNESEEIDRFTQHAIQAKKIQNFIKEQVEKVQKDAFTARETVIQQRSEKITQVREKLQNTTAQIQEKHAAIRNKLNQEAVYREANIRVNRGLEALEHFIQILRDSEMEDEMINKAIRDPIISSTLKSESRKIITSEFFKSVQKQLVMQTEFINIAAHELRTPIMPILVNVELLEEDLGKDHPAIQIITRNAKRLQRLTENILSVTRLDSKSLKLQKESFDINDVILSVIRDESVHLENKNIRLVHKSDFDKIIIEADKDRISQVISNLVYNAIKFTTDGVILVSSTLNENYVTVSVKDSGKGIDSQIMPILFLKFVTKSEKGTGLGLYICKGIVEAHGGAMWAENNTGEKGATLSFRLPRKNNV